MQNRVKIEILTLESKITTLTGLKDSGFATAKKNLSVKNPRDDLETGRQKLKSLIADTPQNRVNDVWKKRISSLNCLVKVQ